jgi:hypothetical protein
MELFLHFSAGDLHIACMAVASPLCKRQKRPWLLSSGCWDSLRSPNYFETERAALSSFFLIGGIDPPHVSFCVCKQLRPRLTIQVNRFTSGIQRTMTFPDTHLCEALI